MRSALKGDNSDSAQTTGIPPEHPHYMMILQANFLLAIDLAGCNMLAVLIFLSIPDSRRQTCHGRFVCTIQIHNQNATICAMLQAQQKVVEQGNSEIHH